MTTKIQTNKQKTDQEGDSKVDKLQTELQTAECEIDQLKEEKREQANRIGVLEGGGHVKILQFHTPSIQNQFLFSHCISQSFLALTS